MIEVELEWEEHPEVDPEGDGETPRLTVEFDVQETGIGSYEYWGRMCVDEYDEPVFRSAWLDINGEVRSLREHEIPDDMLTRAIDKAWEEIR